ncbi:MAG: hypothetical protein AAFR37_23835, partial [Cyanobacteria bacterium J06628_3]
LDSFHKFVQKNRGDILSLLVIVLLFQLTDKLPLLLLLYLSIETASQTPDNLGYPPGFFEQTYGSCEDDPIIIDSEGDFEEREEIL